MQTSPLTSEDHVVLAMTNAQMALLRSLVLQKEYFQLESTVQELFPNQLQQQLNEAARQALQSAASASVQVVQAYDLYIKFIQAKSSAPRPLSDLELTTGPHTPVLSPVENIRHKS